MGDTPIYDRLITERFGRGPAEFEGHDRWEESDEARQAYERGLAEAEATSDQFWGREPATKKPRRRRSATSTGPADTPPQAGGPIAEPAGA